MRKSLIGIFHITCLFALGAFAAIQTSSPSLSKALEAQIALVQANPGDADALNDLGNLLELAQRPTEAEAAYRRAIELDSSRVLPHYNLGLLLQQRSQRQEAFEQFRRVVDLDPNHAWAHYQLGTLYEAQELKDKAVAAYTRAFALDYELTRPSVNPHIIENDLVVEAMLKAYREVAVRPLAPKRYEDASRIVALMVNEPPLTESPAEEGDEGAEDVDDSLAQETPRGGTGSIANQARFDDEGEDEDEEETPQSSSSRVLNPETLRNNPPRNEIVGGGAVGGRRGTPSRSAPRATAPRSTDRGSTVIPRSNTGRSNVNRGTTPNAAPNRDSDRGTVRRPTTPTRLRRGPGFIPSTSSTGRLDWQLRPAPPRGPEPAG